MANEKIYVGKEGAKALYKRLKQQIANITTYQKVTNTTPAGVPVVTNPNTRTIYLVKDTSVVGDDKYKEWIWNSTDGWECIGTTSIPENAWKQWSEDNGSSGEGDSVYIGKNNVLGRDESFVLGQSNTVTVTDETDYSDTDIIEIGTSNSATNAANAYQIGRENTVTGNNLEHQEDFPHSMAVNLGRNNAITGEGLNLGKDNVSENFGITLGQNNNASDMGIAIGENLKVKTSGVAIGLGKHHTLALSMFPSLKNGDDYYPIGQIAFTGVPAEFSYYPYIAFSGGTAIRVLLYNGRVYINAATSQLYCVPASASVSTTSLGDGYLDDNNRYVITSNIPSGKTSYTFYKLKSTTNGSSTRIADFVYTKCVGSPAYVVYSHTDYTVYTYTEPCPAYGSSEIITDGYTCIGDTKVYRSSDGANSNVPPYIKYRVLGFTENGKFIPWFNDNHDIADCNWLDVAFTEVVHHSYDADETAALGYTLTDQEVYLAETGSVAIGDLLHVEGGSVGINSGVYSEYGLANPIKSYSYVREYTGNGESYKTSSLQYINLMYASFPTMATIRSTIFDNLVTGGSIGLFTGNDYSTSKASRIDGGSFGAGHNVNANYNSVVMGENVTASSGSFAYGNGYGLNVSGGSIALASSTQNQNVSNGSILIGCGNSGDLVSGDLVLGNGNKIVSTGSGSAIFGFSNNIYGSGAYCFGYSLTAKNGAMAFGFAGTTAENGAIHIGFNGGHASSGSIAIGYNGSVAEDGSIAIGYNGPTAKNGGIAIGMEGCESEGGFTIGKWTASAKYGGVAIGYNTATAEYGSMTFGYQGATSNSGGMVFGSNGIKATGGALAFGRDDISADSSAIAVGTRSLAKQRSYTFGEGKYAINGSMAIGFSGANIAPNKKIPAFLYYRDSSHAYPVNVKLGGISYVKGRKAYDVNGNLAPIEDSANGNAYYFKSSVSGKLYAKTSDIPYTDYTLKIMAIWNGSSYVPYELEPWAYNPVQPTSYTWIDGEWGTTQGKVLAKECYPYDFGINTASSGSFGLGDMFSASTGGFAIATTQFADSTWSDVPTIQENVTNKTITAADGTTAQVVDTRSLYFGTPTSTSYGFAVYGAYATEDGISIGSGTNAKWRSTAMGFLATASGASLAIGYGTKDYRQAVAESESLVIGVRSTSRSHSIALGGENIATSESWTMGHFNIVDSISIGIGKNNYSSSQSMSMGDYNSTNFNAYAIGSRNNVYGWSLALGVKNKTSYVTGAHTAFIGYLNDSSSNMETLEWVDANTNTYSVMPINTNVKYSISQHIYKSSEIQTGGTIYSISFYLNESAGATRNNISIYLLDTDKAEYSTSYDWVTTTMSPAYSGTVQFVEGWNTIYLTSSYSHDNSKNLSVLVIDNSGTTTSLGIRFKCSADPSGAYTAIYHYNNDSSYSTPTSSMYGNRLNYRPVIKFNFGGTEVCVPDMPALIGNVPTSSIILGALNNSKHYNSILIGVGNQSGVPKNIKSGRIDDDGFTLAIGRENFVGRNFDIAIGYKSFANGGENLAVHHSKAVGYRNIAIGDSTLTNCTANIALCEAKLTTTNSNSLINVVHNALVHSDITVELGGFSDNLIMHTVGGLSTDSNGVHRNIIMVGTEYHRLAVTANTVNNNIIYGFRRGYFIAPSFGDQTGNVTINAAHGSFDRNIFLNNAYESFVTSHANDNIINSSELNITAAGNFDDNIIMSSLMQMSRSANFSENVILGRSKIDLKRDASDVNDNFLMYSYLGDSDNGSAIVTGEYSSNSDTAIMTQNFLYGTNAYHVQATVSFATPNYDQAPERAHYDPSYHGMYPYSSSLIDCCNVVNFGDNLIKGANRVYVFGMAHNVHSSNTGWVYGAQNEISYTSGSIVMGERNYVLGKKAKRPEDLTHTVIIGSNNNVKASSETDFNMIFGANNNIMGHYTVVQKTTAEIASLPANTKEYIYTTADCIYPTTDTEYSISSYKYYMYSNGCLIGSYDMPSSYETVTNTTTLANMYTGRSMTAGKWYKATSGSSYTVNAPSGVLVSGNNIYYHYNTTFVKLGPSTSSTGDIGIYNSFNRIFGHANNVYDHVVDYTLVGAANTVSCTDYTEPYDYAISNGFVQGNNNVALNGSNIISMGNGNQSTGHNSVAIGCQLISNQWQTVLGKYNTAIAGPNRLASQTPQDPTKALLIVGNGYSTHDDEDWQDEAYITRSNALELYADGRLKITGDIEAANIPAAPSGNGSYALTCEVTNGVATYRWVPVGLV